MLPTLSYCSNECAFTLQPSCSLLDVVIHGWVVVSIWVSFIISYKGVLILINDEAVPKTRLLDLSKCQKLPPQKNSTGSTMYVYIRPEDSWRPRTRSHRNFLKWGQLKLTLLNYYKQSQNQWLLRRSWEGYI